MVESEVIAHTLIHLINNESFTPKEIAIRTDREKTGVIDLLLYKGINDHIINSLKVTKSGPDIEGFFQFGQARPVRRLKVEAKGGSVHYGLYTMLGQFITMKTSPSSYYWFAFALSASWKSVVIKYLTDKGSIKPIISDIIKSYTKKGQGLYFYFVQENGFVEKKTWTQFLNHK